MKDCLIDCPACGVEVKLGEDTINGELISCGSCGANLEVKLDITLSTLVEAPQEEEDWGQ